MKHIYIYKKHAFAHDISDKELLEKFYGNKKGIDRFTIEGFMEAWLTATLQPEEYKYRVIQEYYPIAGLTRENLSDYGYDITNVDDGLMRQAASKLGIDKEKFSFIPYGDRWVFPYISTYVEGFGSPIAMLLLCYDDTLAEWEEYTCVTVNLPHCEHRAGCQFIDTNNNGVQIVDWLEENGFGKRTGKTARSGFCIYPELDFYAGESFRVYKQISDRKQVPI